MTELRPWRAVHSDPVWGAAPLIDVRSEKEFAQGAIPGAANIPLLIDADRHEVGLTYKNDGSTAALHLGLERFAARCEAFREAVDASAAGGRKLAVHCWRGGMRSQMVAHWLGAMGYEVVVLQGGYKAFRGDVLAVIDHLGSRELLVLDGRTGAGKSALLARFPPGFPCLDLEGLAHHRGSAFGDFAQTAPVATQQNFENQLAVAALALPETGPVLVEIESMLGPILLAPKLKDRIHTSPIVHVERDFDERAARLTAEYACNWTAANDALFATRCEMLRRHLSQSDLAAVIAAVHRRDFRQAVEMLLTLRYDKIYDKGIARRAKSVIARFDLTRDEDAAVAWITDYVRARS